MSPLYIVIAVIVVAIIALTIVYFIQQKKKKRAAALAAESENAEALGEDEIGPLVREAEAKLAAAKLEGAKAANLPVYLLLGDAASAKTSVMVHSGLDAELVAGQVYQQGNVSSTRSANIWYTRRSLFVEAAGRLLSDASNWKKLVHRLQPKASVVGKGEQAPRAALVFFDCENFTHQGALDAAAASARALRARLGEVCQSFGIRLPVYAVFTKMDRLPFFTEYVRNLSNEEATQVLGVTLPMLGTRAEGVYAEEETARLTGNFERLFRSLADGRIEFLPRETDPTKLPAEYEFPREFRKIRQTVVQFLVDLCRPSQLTTGPFLRGFYFSGVRPIIINETAPVQAAAQQQANYGSASGATGIFSLGAARQAAQAAQPTVTGTRKVPQWLFLGHFFTGVLLADHSAMVASGSSVKTSGARRILFACAAGLFALFALFFTISFFKNRGLENRVTEAANAIGPGEAVGADFASVDSLRKLDMLRQSVETLSTYHREGAPLMYRWGLYCGDELYPQARQLYFARFKQLLFGQAQANDLATLTALPAGNPDYQPTYNALKTYLITTSNHDKSTKLFLTPELLQFWQNGRTADPERVKLAQNQFDFYADELKDANPYSNENDAASIEKTRRYLANFPITQRVYAYMLSEASRLNPPVNFNKQFPGSEAEVVEPFIVQGAFTKAGWAFMKDGMSHLDRYLPGEPWVLGNYASAAIDPAKLEQDVKALYYADFISAWRSYIKSATVVRYASLKDASVKLQQLSGNQSPLLELIALASSNTDVDEPTVKNVFQPVQTVVPPGSTDKFVAPPNQNYMQSLSALQTTIDSIADTPGMPSDQAAAPALTAAQTATGSARQIAQTFRPDTGAKPGVDAGTQKLLEDPITYVLGLIRLLGPAELNAKGKDLCAQVRPIMQKYPFNPKSEAQATLADFDAILDPKKGALWVFYNSNLQKLLQRQGSQFVPVAAGMTVNPAFLAMMNRAAAFTDVAYANGATDPKLTYSVKPVFDTDQESIKLTIDGQTAEFTQASPAAKQFVWPGNPAGVHTSVKYKGATANTYPDYPGLFGIFQFVQDADKRTGPTVEMLLKSGKQGKTVNNEATNQPVTLRFEITANPPVFDPGYFSSMACVAEVVKP